MMVIIIIRKWIKCVVEVKHIEAELIDFFLYIFEFCSVIWIS